MQPDCNGTGVRFRHIPWYWAPKGKCLGNGLNSDFLIIKQFQIFFSLSQRLIFLKCLCLSGRGRYITRLQWERG